MSRITPELKKYRECAARLIAEIDKQFIGTEYENSPSYRRIKSAIAQTNNKEALVNIGNDLAVVKAFARLRGLHNLEKVICEIKMF
jgi:hypothetical protein